jgi:predicted ABC-type ATPase
MTKNKTLYIIAGANGSGKTTFALNYKELNNLHFINADEIAKQYDPNDVNKYKVKAGKEFFKQLDDSLDKDKSFIIETTLSGKYLKKVIHKAKINNFKIILIYLFLETDTENILRVKNRVLNGGHDVPTIDIKRRYARSRELFVSLYKDMVDKWILYFNGDDNCILVCEDGEIQDEELYNKFTVGVK